jgi:phage anti-repressor protein
MINIYNSILGQSIKMTELYDYLELNKSNYSHFVRANIKNNIYCELNKNYSLHDTSNIIEGKKGQFRQEYNIHIDFAKKLCMISKSAKGNQIRDDLVRLTNQVENKDLLSETEILTLSALIGFFKFIENQKDITKRHMTDYVNQHPSKYAFAEFHTLRNNILQISKEEIELKLKEYCIEQNKRLPALKSNRDKIMFIDMYDSLKNAVWDFLYMNGSPTALKLSELAKKMAKAQGISILPRNENNLFQIREMLPQLPII